MAYHYSALKNEDSAFNSPTMYPQSPRRVSSPLTTLNNRRIRYLALVILAVGSLLYFSPESVKFNTGAASPRNGAFSTESVSDVLTPTGAASVNVVKFQPLSLDRHDALPEIAAIPPLSGQQWPDDSRDGVMGQEEMVEAVSTPEGPAPGPYSQLTQANASPFCRNPGSVPEYSRDSPFIVTGTAGTGTRVLYEILHANEIIMPNPMNEERDSLRFILSVKHTNPFGIPNGQMQHTLVNSVNGLNYDINDIPDPARSELRSRTHMVVEDIFEDSRRDLKGHTPKRWGWKEPHSMFVMPFLQEAAPNMTIVHVVRDGRDVAFSNQQRMKYQRFYQREFVRPKIQDDATDREISMAAARLWMKINLETKAWAEKHIPCRYYIVRLEDLCDPDQTHTQVQRLFDQLGVSYTPSTLKTAASSVLYDRCRLEKFRAEPADLVNQVEDLIAPALTAFGYGLNKMPRETDVVSTQYPGLRTRLEELAGVGRRITLTTVNDNYLTTALNWAAFYAANVLSKDASTPPLLIATPSRAVYDQLTGRGFPAFYAPLGSVMKAGQYYGYWRWRVGLLNAMVQMGYSALVTDADAIWNKDVWNLSSDDADGLEQMGDIVASRGVASSMPVALSPSNVASLCMGLVYFSSSEASRNLLANVNHLIQRVKIADDQVITNQVLAVAHQIRFGSDGYKYGTSWSTGHSSISDLRLTLIPHQIIPRDCTHLHPELYDNGATGDSTLIERFPEAAAFHCRSAKDGANKMNMMQANQAWRLRDDWESVWKQWPEGQPWYIAIRDLDAWSV